MQAFSSGDIPWMVEKRWQRILARMNNINFRHSFREINFSADKVAKKGSRLDRGEVIEYEEKPSFLGALEWENQTYFRFC